MSRLGSGTPRKVLRKAHELGVHADCVASDFDSACDACVTVFHDAFHFFYSEKKTVFDVLQAVLDDLYDERNTQ